MKKHGFTLIELSFVIAIIAILASILFPVFARAREAARRSSCASNLSQIGMALNMYAQNYDGHYPKRNNDFRPIAKYSEPVGVLYCPSDATEHAPIGSWNSRNSSSEPPYSSYVYRGGLCNDDRADRIIAGEAKDWHGGIVNVLYLAGYVKGMVTDDYKPVVPPTQTPIDKHMPNMPGMPGPAPLPGG